MKLTALEIKQQQFEKSLRGYDVSEVQAYLNLVASEWEHMVGKMRELESQLEKMDEKLKHYERVEQALHETLQTAKDSAEQKLVGAKKEARNIIEKAEMESDSIVRDANQQRQQIRQSILRLLDRREEIIGGMKSYLEMAQESLNHFSRDDASLFRLPKEDSRSQQDPNSSEDQQEGPSEKRSKQKKEQPIPPGSDNLDDILDEIE
ncbi:DivIVA domain-containing protein [Rhodohalobacter sp. SW132]|uniref:DivIVA domain-containing protein n=1 Tax=Rhodohalobacter sp. SW132 TaxID=2293433 RepID=UPI000E24AAE8|nr:DivIVA domain-containing protein [Rhodohalobacter sp. SW132]REL38933.1 DivIVA domain-containing protein [Rhodohalobacter sp. SW132]